MEKKTRFAWIVILALWGTLAGGSGSLHRLAWAQESRGPSRDGESREDRRERWRRYGERGEEGSSRDGRGRGSDDSGRDGGGGPPGGGPPGGPPPSSRGSAPPGSSSSSATASSSDSKPAAAASSSSASSSTGSMNMTDYAKSLVKQFDKNGDMMLQPEERKELRGRAADADLNKDGTITIDELVAHLSSNAPASSTSSTSGATPAASSASPTSSTTSAKGSDAASKAEADMAKRIFLGTAGGKATAAKEGDKRRSYRFSTAADRLPSNLPSWFKSKDKNGNGQVEMSEYNSSWSKSTAGEFRRYDANDDGVIMPKEAAGK